MFAPCSRQPSFPRLIVVYFLCTFHLAFWHCSLFGHITAMKLPPA
jgi:hypothetical protein